MSTLRIETSGVPSGPLTGATTRVWIDGQEITLVRDIQVRFPLRGIIECTLTLYPESLELAGDAAVIERCLDPWNEKALTLENVRQELLQWMGSIAEQQKQVERLRELLRNQS